MKFLLLTVFLALSMWTSPSSGHPGSRIIGGHQANAGEFPFAAAIYQQTASGTYFCVGTILTNLWILTSASCVDGAVLFQIRVGASNLNSASAVRLSTDTYVMHPDYDPLYLANDIGLIRLRLPISFSDYIKPIGLPRRDVQPYAVVTAIGWGQISDTESGIVEELQTVTLTALSNEECQLAFGSQIIDSMVCVDGNYNQGTCFGDTGGPLIQYINGQEATVVGISSFHSGKGCESTDPSGYSRTFQSLDWIRSVAGIA